MPVVVVESVEVESVEVESAEVGVGTELVAIRFCWSVAV